MATIVKRSLIPEHAKPVACARLRCVMTLRRPDFHDDDTVSAVFVHQDPDGSVDEYPIPTAWVEDVRKCLWHEVEPWLVGLHEAT